MAMSSAEKHQMMMRVAKSLRSRGLRMALNGWAGAVEDAKERLRAMHSAIASLRRKPLRAALNSWADYTVEALEAARALRKAASAFSPRLQSMRKALNRWSDVWVQRQAMRRSMSALTSSGLRAGFNSWVDAALERLNARESMMRVAKSLRSRGLRAAYNGWCEMAEEAASRKAAMRAAIQALRRRPLRASLNTWSEYTSDALEAQRAMRKAASAFSPRLVATRKAWNRWSDLWLQRFSLRRGLSALTSSGLRAGFNNWLEMAMEAAEKHDTMYRVAKSLRSRSLRAALNTWVGVVEELSECMRLLRSAATAFHGDKLRKALNSWIELAWMRSAMRRGASAFNVKLRHVRGAFERWLQVAERIANQLLVKRAAMEEMLGGKRRAAWNSWVDLTIERQMLRQAASCFRSPTIRRALMTWVEMVEEAILRMAAMHCAVSAMRRRPMRAALNTWAAHTTDAMEAHRVLRKAASAFSPRLQSMRKALNRWSDVWLQRWQCAAR